MTNPFSPFRAFPDLRQSRLLPGILLCILLGFALAGCASSAPTTPPPAQKAAPKPATPVFYERFSSPLPSQNATAAPAEGDLPGVPADSSVNSPLPPSPAAAGSVPGPAPDPAAISPDWQPLIARLKTDLQDVPPETVERFFAQISSFSPAPMGVKIKELYTNKFLRKPPDPDAPPKPPLPSLYPGVVSQANKDKCNEFLTLHKAAFDHAEKQYAVPREVIVALLLVETKLGTFLGKEMAFWSLASMAAADTVDKVKDHVPGITIKPDQTDWMQSKLDEKSAWAFKELKAFVRHCAANNLVPGGMLGSVYGAIGICQFMPSNLSRYGADGDGDGRVDLFVPADAIASAAKYLADHGWKTETSFAARREVLKKYNNLTRYANTILAMAESIRTGTLLTAAPDAPKAATKAAAKPAKKSAPQPAKKPAKATPAKPAAKPAAKK